MRFVLSALIASFWLCAAQAWAVEPVDKNFPGPYAGGQVVLGQAFKAGAGSPGVGLLMGFDIGQGIKRDTWNRVELGAELDTGKASFTDKFAGQNLKVDLDLDMVVMIKAGYGYSIGDNAFGVLRAGAGVAMASYKATQNSVSYNGGSSTGVATLLAWDTVYPASDTLDFVFGVSLRMFNFSFNNIPTETFQLNMPALHAGARLRF